MKSPKELSMDKKIIGAVEELQGDSSSHRIVQRLLEAPESHAMQEYDNTVSIKRLGYNDYGPVHMRTVALNAVIMMGLLRQANIPIALSHESRVGDIYKYSPNSIEKVRLSVGSEKPIRIDVFISSELGFSQVEEVLLGKIAVITAKGYIELYAAVIGGGPKRYL